MDFTRFIKNFYLFINDPAMQFEEELVLHWDIWQIRNAVFLLDRV